MSEFAKAQLLKYGWTEGKGLGRNENGITTALKPSLKFDTAGIGHKDDDGNQWWESAYNKAACSLTVDSNTSGISISVSETDAEKSSTDKKSKKNAAKSKSEYGNFLKTSTLSNGHLIPEEGYTTTKVEDIENTVPVVQLTDDELFKACGGRTAHKGARHGFRLNGKLDRIARQEQEMLAKFTSNMNSKSASLDTFKTEGSKLRKRIRDSEDDESETDSNGNSILPLNQTAPEDKPKFSKTSRKKTNRKINDLTHKLDVSCRVDNVNQNKDNQSSGNDPKSTKKGSKKKKKQKVEDDWEDIPDETTEKVKIKKNKDKSHKEKNKNKKAGGTKQYVASEMVSQKLNHKISKKKAAKQERKMKEKLELLTQTFETVHVNTEVFTKCKNPKEKLESIVNNLERHKCKTAQGRKSKRGKEQKEKDQME